MTIVVPAAQYAIVAPSTGVMAAHFREFLAALVANPEAVSGPSFIRDGIKRDVSMIRVTFDLVPATDNVSLHLIARTGAGVDVTAYSWSRTYNDAATTVASVTDTSDPQIILAAAVQSDASVGGISGEVLIHNIQSARYKRVTGAVAHYDGSRERVGGIAGRIDTAEPITGIKLLFSSGDIASGLVKVDAT